MFGFVGLHTSQNWLTDVATVAHLYPHVPHSLPLDSRKLSACSVSVRVKTGSSFTKAVLAEAVCPFVFIGYFLS